MQMQVNLRGRLLLGVLKSGCLSHAANSSLPAGQAQIVNDASHGFDVALIKGGSGQWGGPHLPSRASSSERTKPDGKILSWRDWNLS